MESLDARGMFLVAQDGRIVCERRGLRRNSQLAESVRGLHWKHAINRLLGEGSAPEQLPAEPTCYPANGENGTSLQVHTAPLPSDAKYKHVIFLGEEPAPDTSSHRLCTLGMLAAGAAHEMNNLLTLLSGWASLAASDDADDQSRETYLGKVAEASKQLSGFARDLLALARGHEEHWGRVQVNEVCRRAVELVDYQMEKSNIELDVQLSDEEPVVEGSECELAQTLLNLMMNSRQAMPDGGRLELRTTVDDGRVLVCLKDTGTGIEPEVLNRVFHPFFTTRKEEGGSGLGLAVCRQIVEKHGGKLELESTPGVGTTAIMQIPTTAGGTNVAGG